MGNKFARAFTVKVTRSPSVLIDRNATEDIILGFIPTNNESLKELCQKNVDWPAAFLIISDREYF
jgi:hypothetical protein